MSDLELTLIDGEILDGKLINTYGETDFGVRKTDNNTSTLEPSITLDNPIFNEFQGYYYGTQGQTGITFTVYPTEKGIEASFDFYNLPGKSNAKSGVFIADGEYKGGTTYYFTPREWVDKPSGYIMVDVEVTLIGNVLSGKAIDNTISSSPEYEFYTEKPNTAYEGFQAGIYNDHRYEIVKERLNYQEAKEYAEAKGGYLATINTEGELEFLKTFIKDIYVYDYWIGATVEDGGLVWVNGDAMDYALFDPDINKSARPHGILVQNTKLITMVADTENYFLIEENPHNCLT